LTTSQNIAEPYIYKYLVLSTRERLQRAANALSHEHRRHKVSSWTQGIEFGAAAAQTHYRDRLSYPLHGSLESAIVMYATGLSELQITSDGAAPNGILVCTALVASRTLQQLKLRLEASSMPGFLLSCIGSFQNLRELNISLWESKQPRVQPVDIVPLDIARNWTLPALTGLFLSFRYNTEFHYATSVFDSFSGCALQALKNLTVYVGDIEVGPDVIALREFLGLHTSLSCCTLGATTTVVDYVLPAIRSQATCLLGLPSELGFTALHYATRTLEIDRTFHEDDAELGDVFKLMKVLEQQDRSRIQLIQVKLSVRLTHRNERGRVDVTDFLWTARAVPSEQMFTFVEQMRGHAIRLNGRGILLLDCAGAPTQVGDSSEVLNVI
jgi:hypothetical protein